MRDRVAVVTGGAGGIGSAITARLAAAGMRVAIADLAPAPASVAFGEVCDLSSSEATERFAAGVLERFGRCDVLVNCAARMQLATLDAIDAATWRGIQEVNVQAPLELCRRFVPGMAERGFGRIVNVISNTVWAPPGPGFAAYVASKAALLGLTRALAVELGPRGITVNAVAPGLTSTRAAVEANSASAFAAVRDQQAIPRTLNPGDLAGTVAFLASEDAAMITGQAIRVDGGLVTL